MNTSKKISANFLVARISTRRAETLLEEWANIPTEYPTEATRPFTEAAKAQIAHTDAAVGRLIKRYPEVFRSFPPAPPRPPDAETTIANEHWAIVVQIQRFLRLAWDAPDLRQREWHIFQARNSYHFSTAYMPLWTTRMRAVKDMKQAIEEGDTPEEEAVRVHPPAFTPFEQVMYHFHRIVGTARHCGNPDCPAPYFFAAKAGQKYCSPKCSAPAQREQKREWWRRNRARRTD